MELFEQIVSMGHERVVVCSNSEVGLKAIIAVHNTVLGPGLGGVRMWPYESFDEAMMDVLRLSRGMTYKAAATGLNLGGAKAVIIGDSKKDKTEELLRSFGRFVESLGGLYITAEDVGMRMQDMEVILGETRWVTGVSEAHGGSGDPSPVTAFGVLQGVKAAIHWKFEEESVTDRRVAIQGLGSVGHYLAESLMREGATVIGCDVDPEAVERGRALGVQIVDPSEIVDIECDVFSPCALGASLSPETIPRLRCTIVAGGANNQLADEARDGRALAERGIVYAPDFVINAGGLINVYNELNGYNRDRALLMTRHIYDNVMRIFEVARQQNIPTHLAANHVAEERISRMKALGSRQWSRFTGSRGAAHRV
jgi:leucine dehydrogenase